MAASLQRQPLQFPPILVPRTLCSGPCPLPLLPSGRVYFPSPWSCDFFVQSNMAEAIFDCTNMDPNMDPNIHPRLRLKWSCSSILILLECCPPTLVDGNWCAPWEALRGPPRAEAPIPLWGTEYRNWPSHWGQGN